jgi:hypothetical protein
MRNGQLLAKESVRRDWWIEGSVENLTRNLVAMMTRMGNDYKRQKGGERRDKNGQKNHKCYPLNL